MRARRPFMPSTAEVAARPVHDGIARVVDVMVAGVGLLVLWPLMALIAVAVWCSSRGPALYRGARVGRGERGFVIYKFRTMQVGAEAVIGGRLVRADEGLLTSIGPFLRRYRLDELPQLWNVLRGEMALVGPRPVRPVFLGVHGSIAGYRRRFLVRPGITGLAQVRGGYYTSARHKLLYDMLYVSRRSLRLDAMLVALTGVRLLARVFTTTLLLGWLLVAVLLLPGSVQQAFTVWVGGVGFNLLYAVPVLTVVVHLARKRAERVSTTALRTPLDGVLVAWVVVSAVAAMAGPDAWAGLRGLAWYGCNGVVVSLLVMNSRMVTTARGVLLATVVGATAGVGAVDVMARLVGVASGLGFGRVAGTLVSPLLFATVAVLVLPVAVVRARAGRGRALWAVAAGVLAVALVGASSRAGLVAAGLGLAVAWAPGRASWAKVGAVVGAVGLAVVLVGAGMWAAGNERWTPARAVADLGVAVERQGTVLAMLDADPALDGWRWTGIGPRMLGRMAQRDEWRDHKPPLKLDSMVLTVWVDHGPVGVLLFAWLGVGGIGLMLRARLSDAAAAADLRAVAGGLVGVGLMLAVSDGLYALPVMVAVAAMMGLGVGLAVVYRPGPRASYRLVRRRDPL